MLQEFLEDFRAGTLLAREYMPPAAGVRAQLLTTDHGRYVLTVFAGPDGAEMIPGLADFLAEHHIPCPRPLTARSGTRLRMLDRLPAVLSHAGSGTHPPQPDVTHCASAGALLAQIHLAGRQLPLELPGHHRVQAWRNSARQLQGRLGLDDGQLLAAELEFQTRYRLADLPSGLIQQGLVRASVLAAGGCISGLAAIPDLRCGVLLQDLAATVNDWCSRTDGALDRHLASALLGAYHARRPLTGIERGAWPVLLRAAALHGWLSALYDAHFPLPGWDAAGADPEAARRILLDRIRTETVAREAWPAAYR